MSILLPPPARLSPYTLASLSDKPAPTSQSSIPSTVLTPRSQRRARIFSKALTTFQEKEARDQQGHKCSQKLTVSRCPSQPRVPKQAKSSARPSEAFSSQASTCLPSGANVTVLLNNTTPKERDIENKADEESILFWTNTSPSSSQLSTSPDHDDLALLMSRKLQLGGPQSISSEQKDNPHPHMRHPSSVYASEGDQSLIMSPAWPPLVNRISLSDLPQFIDTADRFDDDSSTFKDKTGQDVVSETAAAVSGWREESASGKSSCNLCEHVDGTAIVPIESPASPATSKDNLHHTIGDLKKGFRLPHKPSFASRTLRDDSEELPRKSKRKASHSSLQIFSESFVKRPRLGLEQLVTDAYRNSIRFLIQVKRNWRKQEDKSKREYEA